MPAAAAGGGRARPAAAAAAPAADSSSLRRLAALAVVIAEVPSDCCAQGCAGASRRESEGLGTRAAATGRQALATIDWIDMAACDGSKVGLQGAASARLGRRAAAATAAATGATCFPVERDRMHAGLPTLHDTCAIHWHCSGLLRTPLLVLGTRALRPTSPGAFAAAQLHSQRRPCCHGCGARDQRCGGPQSGGRLLGVQAAQGLRGAQPARWMACQP